MSNKDYQQLDDYKLVNMTKKGDTSAFEQLVMRYQDKVYNLALRFLNDLEDATDATQDVFLNIYKNIKSFKGQSSFYTWLYRTTINKSIDILRRKAKSEAISLNHQNDDEESFQLEPVQHNNPLLQLEAEERQKLVQKALSQLNEEQRQIIILRDIENLSYQQIAQVLDISVGSVRSRLYHARIALRQKIMKLLETGIKL